MRLRSDRETTLTFKSPPPESDGRCKAYREREDRIDDFDTMDAIFATLGFHRTRVYEKRRETWRWHGTTLCLDTLPYGRFLEIEGQPNPIVRVVELLGLRWERRILATYLGMFALLKDKAGLPFDEITFDNFAALDVPFDRYLHLFEAGHGGSPD